MKAKFLVCASLPLCGCGHDATQSIDRADLEANPVELIAISHYSLPLDDAGDQETAGAEVAGADENVEYSYSSNSQDEAAGASRAMHSNVNDKAARVEKITDRADTVHADISDIWKKEFIPMYDKYRMYGIDKEKVAEQLETLHESYKSMEREVKNIKVPESLAPEYVTEIEELKSDLSLAISNRTLALIEFKLMNEAGEDNMHSELLGIHTENSRKYLNSAETHLETLDGLEPEDYSADNGELVTTQK